MPNPQEDFHLIALRFAVTDLDRSIRFYTEGLGFVATPIRAGDVEPGTEEAKFFGLPSAKFRGTMLSRPEIGLEMVEFMEPRSQKSSANLVTDPGLSGFVVRMDDVESTAKRLVELGAKITFDGKTGGGVFRSFVVTDPDGVRIQIVGVRNTLLDEITSTTSARIR